MKAVNNEVEDFAGGRWAGIVRECVQGALNTHLTAEEDQIVSLYHRCTLLYCLHLAFSWYRSLLRSSQP